MKTEKMKLSDLNWGDTVVIGSITKTIGKHSVKKSEFGLTLDGDPFRNGIERVLFPNWKNGKMTGYIRQR